MALRSPMPWFGSKATIAKDVVRYFPKHRCYVELFGGSGAVLLAKKPSIAEVYNDLHSSVVNFWTMLQKRPKELIRQCCFTLLNREDFELGRKCEDIEDPMERARVWFVHAWGCYGRSAGTREYTGFKKERTSSESSSSLTTQYRNAIQSLAQVHSRMHKVPIENRSALELIAGYNTPDTLLYADPPYLLGKDAVRKAAKHYKHEMTIEDHEAMAELLQRSKAKVCVSLYDEPLARELYKGFCVTPISTGIRSQGLRGGTVRSPEVIFTNFETREGMFS